MFHFIKRNGGPNRQHNRSPFVVWICRTLFFSFSFPVFISVLLYALHFRFFCFVSSWLFLGGWWWMNSMPYTQKEGRCLWCGKMEDGGGAEEERQEEDEAQEGNKNGTWVYLSLSCNEQHSLSLFLYLSTQMCHSFVFSMKTKRESFFLLSSLFVSPSSSSLHHLHFFFPSLSQLLRSLLIIHSSSFSLSSLFHLSIQVTNSTIESHFLSLFSAVVLARSHT